ncbi:SNG1 family protein [Amycolatopsis acidiphila]|uniref:DUF3533 domain-containing protein n=1 Tax=Amycolatopsis acidiphila TaxID=715473 RepID=A0A558A837_9PSEU|nr:DUF3533 domain-containing protein [Amycolatopsis acidiphila]TVT20416.1 DUF3533 domain-containing protein [Amycolatopsis acidiphila]UIJ59216.1 SNG1 family protein [Amycolatopsis acidiphila]GHG79192.1 membrane protein [Amycolatopsis acidiphila]
MKTEERLRDAIPPRTILLVAGVLLLQLGFILSYVGAFHSPAPHRVTLAVVGPQATVDQLDELAGAPLDASTAGSEAEARARILDREVTAGLVLNPSGTTDTLLVASAGGPALATAVQQVVTQVETAQGRTVNTVDLVAPEPGDARALTGFYAVVGWLVGGYLAAAALGIARGARPATLQRTGFRLGAMVPYAILSGLGGALILDQWLHALTGHFFALWWIGAMLTFAAATVTMAFQVLFGVIGVGVTVLVFVILGNPSAGGAYQAELLPTFWRAIGGAIPNGAGTEALRNFGYFDGHATLRPLLVIAIWGVAGLLVTLVASALRLRRRDRLG